VDEAGQVAPLLVMGLSYIHKNEVTPYCQGQLRCRPAGRGSPYALSFAAAMVLPLSVPVTVTRAPTLMFFAVPITQCVIAS
jgi:hypothetical protein